jgi:hypothetical protein
VAKPTIPVNISDPWIAAVKAAIETGELSEFVHYAEAAKVTTEIALDHYRRYLEGGRLPNGTAIQHPTGKLAKFARMEERDFLDWHLMNDAAHAEAIEKGTAERDMKKGLPTYEKSRKAKDGTFYLIVPFRHSIPGATATGMKPMPKRVYEIAQHLKRSKITGNYQEPSVTRAGMVTRNVYKWGQKVTVGQLEKAGLSFREQSHLQGMYKFGAKGQSQYITFRVMSQKSAGWIIPARPGLYPARYAKDEALREMNDTLNQAIMMDLQALSGLL